MLEKERFMVGFGHKMHFREIERFPRDGRLPGGARYLPDIYVSRLDRSIVDIERTAVVR